MSAAESKASEIVAAERAKMERMLNEARRQATEDAITAMNHQEDSDEVRTIGRHSPTKKTGSIKFFDAERTEH